MLKRRICAYFLLMSMLSGCLAGFGGCKDNASSDSNSQVQSSVENSENSSSNNESQESDSDAGMS